MNDKIEKSRSILFPIMPLRAGVVACVDPSGGRAYGHGCIEAQSGHSKSSGVATVRPYQAGSCHRHSRELPIVLDGLTGTYR